MSGKDHKKSAVHYTQRNLAKEHNSANPEACMTKVGSQKAGKAYISAQLMNLGFKRISSREFINPETNRVRIVPR